MKDNYLYDEELHENLKRTNSKKKIYTKKNSKKKSLRREQERKLKMLKYE